MYGGSFPPERSHCAALAGAFLAFRGTFGAMIILEHGAAGSTFVTDSGAQGA